MVYQPDDTRPILYSADNDNVNVPGNRRGELINVVI